jgi:hypothetical protein
VQALVDRAANFNLFSIPNASEGAVEIPSRDGAGVIGLRISETLHRFRIVTEPATEHRPFRASNMVGEPVGKATHRWMFLAPDSVAAPGQTPPETRRNPGAPQRFAMLDSEYTFGGGEDGFRGFGAGQVAPSLVNGQQQMLVTAVGTIVEGFGKFQGHEQGTYVYCGRLTDRGYTGSVFLRVMDQDETFSTDRTLPELEQWENPEPDITYVLFRGQAVPADPVSPNIGPGGQPIGLVVVQGLRTIDIDCAARGHRGLQSTYQLGPAIGQITATVAFNPAAPGGSNLDPIPFVSSDECVFWDPGRKRLGSFIADSSEGRVFRTKLGQADGIRFGGTGPVRTGTEVFSGIRGLMTDDSVVVFEPHVSASVYILRLQDPEGRFRIR